MNKYTLNDINIGTEENFSVTITQSMMDDFCNITGDCNPLHKDIEYARAKGHKSTVVYGMLTAAFLSTLAGMYIPGERSLIQSVETKFTTPVYVGDKLNVKGIVEDVHEVFKRITLKVIITNQDNKKVCRGRMQIGLI